ncbi:MAG: lasso peptide biosynthesis B2 protein [Longimicrobiales bacterium]
MSTRAPGLAVCAATLFCMDVLPRAIGLRRTFALLRRLTPDIAEPHDADALIAETTHRVFTAAAFYPRRALCLEQSLTLFLLLRRRGVRAELRLGVQPRPFRAHAWIDAGGKPIGESADLPLTLAAFPSLGI